MRLSLYGLFIIAVVPILRQYGFIPPQTKEEEIQQLEMLKSLIDKKEKSKTD